MAETYLNTVAETIYANPQIRKHQSYSDNGSLQRKQNTKMEDRLTAFNSEY